KESEFYLADPGSGGAKGIGGEDPQRLLDLYIDPAYNNGTNGDEGLHGFICPRVQPPALESLNWIIELDEMISRAFEIKEMGLPNMEPDMGVFHTTFDGGVIDTSLITPSGIPIGPKVQDPNIMHMRGLGHSFELYLINEMEMGNWTVQLFGADVPDTGKEVTVYFYGILKNQAPVADAGPDKVVECSSHQGGDVTLDAHLSSDPDNDYLTYTWTDEMGNVIGSNQSLSMTVPLGSHDFTMTVEDFAGGTDSDSMMVEVTDSNPPILALSTDILVVNYSSGNDPGSIVDLSGLTSAVDVCSPTVTIENDAPSYFPGGPTIVTFTATDESGNTARAYLLVMVVYEFGGFRPPIRSDGSHAYKSGRTIPVKFRLLADDGTFISGAGGTLSVFKITGNDSEPIAFEPAGSSNVGNYFRCDKDEGQYIYNLKTKGFDAGEYLLLVQLDDGSSHSITVTVRN
ncbi:MAG: PKD domain-containing protein, partial [Thermoplasmata archaeon]|nr:PKD domain-containing protein [Thermoplasmata archaeon]